jgi:hypothetical protein
VSQNLRLAAATLIASFGTVLYAAPIPRNFEIDFTRFVQPGAAPTFDLRLGGLAFNDTVIGPTGRVYNQFGFPPSFPPTNLSESQLYAELVGTWTINAFVQFGQPAEVHHFQFNPFSVDDFFPAAPTIVSPQPNSIVPPNFVISWEWPLGVTPPTGKGVGASGGTTGVTINFGDFDGNSMPVSTTFTGGVTQATYNFNAGSVQFFNNLTSAPTTTASNPVYTYSVFELYSNDARVSNVTVVVPEPSAGALTIALALGTVVIRRKR